MPRSEIYFSICFVGSKSSKSSRVFEGYRGSDIIVHGLLVPKVAKCIFRKNNIFTLVFDLSVATPGKRISEGQFQALYGGPLIKVFMRF